MSESTCDNNKFLDRHERRTKEAIEWMIQRIGIEKVPEPKLKLLDFIISKGAKIEKLINKKNGPTPQK